jgi:hypothetical protein
MSTNKKTETTKQPFKKPSPDSLTKMGTKSEAELAEKELGTVVGGATGGAGGGKIKF